MRAVLKIVGLLVDSDLGVFKGVTRLIGESDFAVALAVLFNSLGDTLFHKLGMLLELFKPYFS